MHSQFVGRGFEAPPALPGGFPDESATQWWVSSSWVAENVGVSHAFGAMGSACVIRSPA